jgi:SAM-dependent methyltransferase
VYSSNFLEHVSDEVVEQVLREAHRCLAPGGVIRIVVPDFVRLHEEFLAGEYENIDLLAGGIRKENWAAHGVQDSVETRLLYIFASLENMHLPDVSFPEWHIVPEYYCGPPIATPGEIRLAAESLSTGEFSEWAVGLDRVRIEQSMGHINWFGAARLEDWLTAVGFVNPETCHPRESRSAKFRSRKFDSVLPWAVYVEASR